MPEQIKAPVFSSIDEAIEAIRGLKILVEVREKKELEIRPRIDDWNEVDILEELLEAFKKESNANVIIRLTEGWLAFYRKIRNERKKEINWCANMTAEARAELKAAQAALEAMRAALA